MSRNEKLFEVEDYKMKEYENKTKKNKNEKCLKMRYYPETTNSLETKKNY